MSDREQMINDAERFGDTYRKQGTSGWELMADFAIEKVDIAVREAVKAERKRIAGQLYELWTQSDTDLDYRHKVAEFAKKLLEAE